MMERLTKHKYGIVYAEGDHISVSVGMKGAPSTVRGDIVDRLAAYEDTGLEPKEVATIAKSYPKLFDMVDELEKYRKAEREGHLVVPPNIKKYKTLYWLWGDMIMPVQYLGIIGGTTRAGDGKFHVTCKMRTKKSRDFHKERREAYTVPAGESRYFYADDIGKIVFLTREEAEAALGRGTD